MTGTPEERGILTWRAAYSTDAGQSDASRRHVYDFPFIQPMVNRIKFFRHIPCCSVFQKNVTPEDLKIRVDVEYCEVPEKCGDFETQYGRLTKNHKQNFEK